METGVTSDGPSMKYDRAKHHRRSIRLKEYDYRQFGAYFVTVCTQNRACLFGAAAAGEMQLNNAGEIAKATWNELPARFPLVGLDAFVVMPNHIHGVIIVGAQFIAPSDGFGMAAIDQAGGHPGFRMARQLLRTCHSRRRISESHPAIHSR